MVAGQFRAFVVKYDSAGNVVWAQSAGGTLPGFVGEGNGIAVDGSGNSYVTGEFFGSATFGPFTLTSAGVLDIFVAKYDSTGNVVWASSAGGASTDRGRGIAVDGSGNIYVTGKFAGIATFGATTLASAGDFDVFVAKLSDVPSAGTCGDNVVNQPSEQCDGADDSACPGSCLVSSCLCPISGICGDNVVNQAIEQCDGADDSACPGSCVVASCLCPIGGTCPGPCSGDDCDGDGIEDILDEDDTLRSIAWADNSTTPVNFSGSIIRWGGATMTVCDLASPEGVEITTVTGGPATASSNCPSESMRARTLAAGESVQFDCLTSTTLRAARAASIAQATAIVGDIEVELVHLSTTIASVMLPEGNAVRFTQDTLLVSAPATNTVPLMMYNGPRDEVLGPGESMTIIDDVNVPAVSDWGLLILALALLAGVTFKFARRRAVRA